MEKLKAYIVTKGSIDGTISVGDLIWLSNNLDLNNADQAGGHLSKDEWDVDGTNDFEYEESKDYYIELIGEHECVERRCENKL